MLEELKQLKHFFKNGKFLVTINSNTVSVYNTEHATDFTISVNAAGNNYCAEVSTYESKYFYVIGKTLQDVVDFINTYEYD